MKKEKKQNKENKMDKNATRLKQLVMTFHPASCRSIQNTVLQLRADVARHVA